MKKLTITLKQHTPLIHFQYDQKGVTLRASEVKPRLDRFLIGSKPSFGTWGKYLVGYLHVSEPEMNSKDKSERDKIRKYCDKMNAKLCSKFERQGFCGLDYKLRIISKGEPELIENGDKKKNLPMYFADGKMGVFYVDDIILEFSSWHPELISIIESRFRDFIARTNFGTRQTKGYGCFYLKGEADLNKNADFSFSVQADDVKMLFDRLSDFYAVIRPGINNGNVYIKSALYKYLKDVLHVQWDKKTIKQHFYTPKEKETQQDNNVKRNYDNEMLDFSQNTGDEKIYKEFLGLSTIESWARVCDTMPNKHELKREHIGGVIKRFKSPILFKPIKVEGRNEYIVYIILASIPEEMKKAPFKFMWDGREELIINTADNFDLQAYFKWIYDNRGHLIADLASVKGGQTQQQRVDVITKCFKTLTYIKNE